MSRKISRLFWCGLFVAVFGSYLLLTNLMSIITYASLYTSYFAQSSLTPNMSGLYFVLFTNVVMLVFDVVLVGIGVYVLKKGMGRDESYEAPPVTVPVSPETQYP